MVEGLAIDQEIHERVRSLWEASGRTTFWDALFLNLTPLGGRFWLTVLVIGVVGLLLGLRRYRTAVYVLVVVLGALFLSQGAKRVVHRPRPQTQHPEVIRETSGSFPSGHALNAAAVYLTLALVAWPVLPSRGTRLWVLGWCLAVTLLVGLSRIYLGVHYLTDVLGGWTAGWGWALACHGIARRIADRGALSPTTGATGRSGPATPPPSG